ALPDQLNLFYARSDAKNSPPPALPRPAPPRPCSEQEYRKYFKHHFEKEDEKEDGVKEGIKLNKSWLIWSPEIGGTVSKKSQRAKVEPSALTERGSR
ncbi:hypothetical protein COCON_G00236050, partial [Conger conger]